MAGGQHGSPPAKNEADNPDRKVDVPPSKLPKKTAYQGFYDDWVKEDDD